jgi:hypothetical protein
MTEDEKILSAMSSEFTVKRSDNLTHPSEYKYLGVTPIPPIGYVCLGCNTLQKHFRSDCASDVQSSAQDGGKSLDKVQRPHGIPKSQLRKVKECERGNAMKDDDGNYVMRVTKPSTISTKPMGGSPPPPPSKLEQTERGVCTDWFMADQFCITYARGRKRRRHVHDVIVAEVFDFDFERVLATQDQEVKKRKSNVKKHNTVCTHWLRGMCAQGSLECEFVHRMDQDLMPDCKFFKNGQCVNEDACMFRHVAPVKVHHPCPRYVMGFCPQGPRCSLDHVKRVDPNPQDFRDCGFREPSRARPKF